MAFGRGHDDSRGRQEAYASTGRGGAGNAVRSPSRGRPVTSAEEEQKAADFHAQQEHVRAGRGGAGNVRSPSRDPASRAQAHEADLREKKMTAEAIKHDQHAVHSSGRGGMGNMAGSRDESPRGREGIGSAIRSLSRSRSRDARSSSAGPKGRNAAPSETGGEKLSSVDESSTLNGHDEGKQQKAGGGFMSKIAHALPHHHASSS